MIVYIRSSLIEKDVRAQKYMHYLKKDEFCIIHWDRKAEYQGSADNIHTFCLPASYGARIRSLLKFIRWNFYVLRTLYKMRNQFRIIQICDLDSFFAAIPFKLLGKKIIFDVYDFFTDSKITSSNSPLYTALYQLEMGCLRCIDLVILPLESRLKHLNFKPKKVFVCENVPLLLNPPEKRIKLSNKIEIVYAGTLEAKNRGLEWIPEIAKSLIDKIHFTIAGDGGLADFFKNASRENNNITYLGAVSHTKALELQFNADLIYAIYRTHLTNNVLAAPNKFYESLYLETPIIINSGVLISEVIDKNKIGFIVQESMSGLVSFLQNLTNQDISLIAQNASLYWSVNYSHYLPEKYGKEYQVELERLTR